MRKTGIKSECIATAMGPLMNVVSNISFVIIAAFGGYFAINGLIPVGLISAFIVYAMQFSRPINALANLYAQIETPSPARSGCLLCWMNRVRTKPEPNGCLRRRA